MRKLGLTFYCITLMLICQALVALGSPVSPASAEETAEETAAPESTTTTETKPTTSARSAAIIDHCAEIKDDLKKVQKDDSRARIYLGGRFETVNSKFVIPLNTRLVENSLSTPELVENQNDLTKAKTTFVSDFIDYQKELESLVNIDCKSEPENFYQTLEKARQKREIVKKDVAKIRGLLATHEKDVAALKESL